MSRRNAALPVVPLLLALVTASPAGAGKLDDTEHHIKVTYDDATWKAAGGWPLSCIDAACVELTCGPDEGSSGKTDEQALKHARDIQPQMLDGLDMKVVQEPALVAPGKTTGVYFIYADEKTASSFYAFDFMAQSSAKRMAVTCEGETRDGKPIGDMFLKLIGGIELY